MSLNPLTVTIRLVASVVSTAHVREAPVANYKAIRKESLIRRK